ncbi:isoaspartyl peptidase/L-asparaginase [bacterium]|nr:isoaspartyl peptidase/L-asparaginase [bacterium]MBU1675197.1 isoaspartyl peptidase/L-asparaginase [bacterium]
MISRRDFLKTAAAGSAVLGTAALGLEPDPSGVERPPADGPLVVSTWEFGAVANEAAWTKLLDGAPALDAVIAGVAVAEADPANHYVGLGGYPDRDGNVTLDASVMDHRGDAGAVAGLRDVVHAAAVARAVMERTPHVMLVGEGARRFALDEGFPRQDLLTPEAEAAWRKWLDEDGTHRPRINAESHDTIGMLAIDARGDLSGACTTSGLKWKMRGRVGDSPIIGAALYVDDRIGAACATGLGEAVIKTCGSFLVVENMRRGMGPPEACRDALQRIADTNPDAADIQVGYIAMTRDGRVGGCALQAGFSFAVRGADGGRTVVAPSFF